ncbi:hypothetical protein PYW08_002975 [Mythimna loreyi]|uniref:Uncharacterized protein n=1 Tax=Mythimna loreyi TaxID=667449 RepID=A0ACC2QQF2_9NEOP|nr:hypothetical protein PYW08_002975 [Mythimna loreyi]
MNFGVIWCFLLLASSCSGKWRWPEGDTAASVRIDTKVRFIDTEDDKKSQTNNYRVQADEVPFQEPDETEGFYNRPPGAGRYPVRVEAHREPYRVNGQGIFHINNQQQNGISDGTLDSLQFCKCVSKPDCNPRPDSASACGLGKFLCCYPRPNRGEGTSFNNEYFNEVDGQRPQLQPGRENFGDGFGNRGVLVGPDGPTGVVGPQQQQNQPAVLVGPGGPTGIIGPQQQRQQQNQPAVLVGPGGPTGIIGPQQQRQQQNQPAVLVGPGGPTGIIGPAQHGDALRSPSAQNGFYVGPSGFGTYGRRPVLVGPGGPTGIIGPNRGGRPVLVGPGGPTGIIGPAYGRRPDVLVGPGGPTGQIGPQGFFGK